MKERESSYFLVVIMAVMIAVIIASLGMESAKSKMLPIIIGSIVFILAAIALCGEIFAKDKSGAIGTGTKEADLVWRSYLMPGAWTLCFFFGIYLFGFIVTIPLFVLSYMKTQGTGWPMSIIFSVITIIFIYGIFEFGLKVNLYPGVIFK